MALSTYDELQAAVASWLNRDDLAGTVPDLIALAEAQIGRRLRRFTIRRTVQFTAESFPLPADCAELRSLRLVSNSPRQDGPLSIVTPEALASIRASRAGVAGRPIAASVVDRELLLAPAPDATYDAELAYFEALVPLSAVAPVNTVLTAAPDLYLFGALKEAEAFLDNDERIAVWAAKYEAALAELDAAREREEYAASMRPVRLPRAF